MGLISGDGAILGGIFIGGLARTTTYATFAEHFGKYGIMFDSVIMKDPLDSTSRGFGFVTYANPSVVDTIINDTHVLDGKRVQVKRNIRRNQGQSKTIFVRGIPKKFSEGVLKKVFSKYGEVVEHHIIRDHVTNLSRGFGFVTFENEDVVNDLLSVGMIDMAGTQVEIRMAESKKPSNPPPAAAGAPVV